MKRIISIQKNLISELYKLAKKRVLLLLIMSKFYNLLKINVFQKLRIPNSIIKPLLIHYYSHYYSLLICPPSFAIKSG